VPTKNPTISLKVKDSTVTNLYIIVSKNVSLKANKRNLIKRRLKESIKEVLKSLPKNKTLFFYAKKGILEQSYQEIKKEVSILIKKENL
jgi:ribonuclease P protein component